MREYDEYRAVYCGLCRALGDSLGVGTRFTLSYDATLYALVAIAVNGSAQKIEDRHCAMNPLKKCKFMLLNGEEYEKAAALSVLMTYHKAKDNMDDESFAKSLASRTSLPYLTAKYKKAKQQYPWIAEIIDTAMQEQTAAEALENPSIDACSEPTAKMLSRLMEELAAGNSMLALPLKQFGYFLGRWVYQMDAADDLKSDLKSNSFNPLISKLSLQDYIGKEPSKQFIGEVQQRTELFCNELLNANLSMIIPAVNLIEFQQFEPIIQNIVQKGLPQVQKEILFLHVREKKKDRQK